MKQVLIITGPTASGKTQLAEDIALRHNGEIINADVGQFYVPLTVGTAKPDWQSKPFRSHLFDIINDQTEINITRYRQLVCGLVAEIQQRGHIPIIVGGSAFYIKSLFFPPAEYNSQHDPKDQSPRHQIDTSRDTVMLWEMLNKIDPARAQKLHQNDQYRIVRALDIWQKTGQLPSSFEPRFSPPFPAHIVFLVPEYELLCKNIEKRTYAMVECTGWIEEAQRLLTTPWEDFIQQKRIIGYPQIFAWIKAGGQRRELGKVIESIVQETRQYAKRQIVFLKKFKADLDRISSDSSGVKMSNITHPHNLFTYLFFLLIFAIFFAGMRVV